MKSSDNNIFKKIFKFLHSMKFGIILLIVIGIFSIVGTLIPQNKPDAYYASNYQGFFYEMIKTFELSKVYYSFWYIGLMVLLIINLFFCSIRRFIPIMKRVTKKPDIKRILEEYKEWTTLDIEENRIQDFAQDLGFRKLESQSLEGKKVYFKNKNPMGHLGSWLTHISLIIIILAFAYGSYTGYEVYVYGVPGTVHNVEGTDYQVQIDDFEMQLDNDMAVSQYITSLTLLEKGLPVNSGQTMVNYPFRGKDIKIYQNATGWAVHANLYKDDKAYSEKILYNTEYFVEDNEKIVLQLVNFFPDLDMANPMAMKNLSPLPNNPVMLYALFYNKQRVDMGLARMGNAIEYKEYKFVVDKPEMYTLLQINHDPGIAFAAFGGLLQVLGLLLAFYLRPKELRIVVDDGKVYLWSQSYGNDNLYKEELTKIIKKWEDK